MKKTFITVLMLMTLSFISISAQAQDNVDRKDYLIVVANSADKAANESTLSDLKSKFKDAGMYYDSKEKQYYVYIEKYYSKSGADYAVWWHKKENKQLPKVWAKAVPVDSKN